VNFFLFFRLKRVGWDNKTPVLQLSSHKSEDTFLSYNWKSKYEKNFFKSYFTITDYGACSVVYPYLDFEFGLTKNATNRQYDGLIVYKEVIFIHNKKDDDSSDQVRDTTEALMGLGHLVRAFYLDKC
jgi:hypothetical protein